MINQSKKNDTREWRKWSESGALGAGKAYAFFDCDASKAEIEQALPEIRQDDRTPRGLQMKLHEGISELQLDGALAKQIQYSDDYRVMSEERMGQGYESEARPLASLRYALVATCSKTTNERTAKELGDLMNYVHLNLDKDQGLFRGAIVYLNDNREWVLNE